MAEILPVNFPVPGESSIASYNYTDLAEGVGYVIYYGISSTDSVGTTHFLHTTAMYDGYNETTGTGNYTAGVIDQAAFTAEIDIDFDLSPYNLPKIVNGTVRIIVSIGAPAGGAGNAAEAYVTFTLYHWDGATETSIGTVTSPTLVLAENTTVARTYNLEIDASAGRHFKKGEILRLNAKVYGKRTQANNRAVYIWHDPKDIDAMIQAEETHILEAHIPYKIDL